MFLPFRASLTTHMPFFSFNYHTASLYLRLKLVVDTIDSTKYLAV